MSLNYEVRVNNLKNGDWISVSYPAYGTKYGDVETGIMWVGQEFVDLGYVIGEARAYNFPDYTIKRLKQTVEYEWQILTQTNFLKVAQALGLDLSSYHCDHITQ